MRLTQGRADAETVYSEDPSAVAAGFKAAGAEWVHVVDLDGAFAGEPRNLATVKRIVALGLRVQLGGGLRTRQSVESALAMGVERVVIGTRAAESEDFRRRARRGIRRADRRGHRRQEREGRRSRGGWTRPRPRPSGLRAEWMPWASQTLIHTDVGTDGMLTGPNIAAQEAMLGAVGAKVIASGGVGCLEDVIELMETRASWPNLDGVIVGKAIYEGRVSLADLLAVTRAGRG